MKKLILLLAVLLAACMPSADSGVVLPILATPTAYIDPASYPTAQVELAAPNQTVSGIEVRMDRAWVEG